MKKGWIKIHRQIMEKGYYKDSEYIHLWLHILLKANHEPKEFLFNGKVIKINRGQFLTGLNKLSGETQICRSKVFRILKCFESEKQIGTQKTNRFTIISVKNYNKHQGSETQIETPAERQRNASGTPAKTNKNVKKEKNVKNIYTIERELEKIKIHKSVKKEIEQLIKTYGMENLIAMIDRFNIYQKEFTARKWDLQYRLKKRWNKFIENIQIFETIESLNQELEIIAKRNVRSRKDEVKKYNKDNCTIEKYFKVGRSIGLFGHNETISSDFVLMKYNEGYTIEIGGPK